MSVNLSIHLDKSFLKTLPDELAMELERKGLCEDDTFLRVSFCGVVMLGDHAHVFVPRASQYELLDAKDQIQFSATTLKAIEKYGREKSTRVNIQDEDDGSVGLSQLSLFRHLLEDFRKYGIYSRRRVIRTVNNAKPDWTRTISRSIATLDSAGRPIYLDISCTQKKNTTDSEISAIHAHVIQSLDRKFSWMVTGRSGRIAPELNDYPEPSSSIDYQIYILKKELHQTYADRDMRLIKLLIQYLSSQSGNQKTAFIAGVRSFHFAWEHMLRNVLLDVLEVNHLLPAPCYIDVHGKVLSANDKAMRTDIVIENVSSKKLSVIDAKYYAAISPESSPGWGDLVKQFFYAKALKLIKPESDIRNIFLFPGNQAYMTAVRVKERNSYPEYFYDDEFLPLECIYVCPMKVINSYSSGGKMRDLTLQLLG